MSKKARTATVAQNLGREHFAAPPRAAHVHAWDHVRTNGNRIRRGCPCGSWTKWHRMTELEAFAYRPKMTARRFAQAVKHMTNAAANMATEFKEFGKQVEELATVTEQKNYARALLAQARTDAVGDTAHEVDRITGEAGVTVEPTALDDAINDAKPGGFIAVMCSKHSILGCGECKMAVVNLDNFGIIDPPDDRDYSDTSVTEDFEPEPTYDHDEDCNGQCSDCYADKDMCYLILGTGDPQMMPCEDAHQALDEYMVAHPFGPHQIGDALWDDDLGEWKLPPDIANPEEMAILADFVAESFGVDGDPDQVSVEDHKPTWQITLDWGNDTTDVLSWDGWDYGASHLIQYLNTKKRGDLEFAARKLGIRGVTTKVKKELLIRALVAMADTSLVHEHALNRAAVMLYATPRGYASGGRVFDSDTEWAKHYAGRAGQ